MRRLSRGERNKGANLDIGRRRRESRWSLLIKIDEPTVQSSEIRKRRRSDTEQTANPNTHNGA